MSELRQRKGGEAAGSKDETVAESPEEKEANAKRFLEEVNNALDQNKPGTVKGLSNQSKTFKDALMKDPMNMDLIFHLGVSYCMDQQWDKAINVMMRGWKRIKEIEDKNVRIEFLMALTQASEKENKFKQALAVLNDIEDCDDDEKQRKLDSLRCRVHCQNGDKVKGLAALKAATAGIEFDKAAATWASLIAPLKKADAYDASKSNMQALAADQKQRDTLDAMEKLVVYRDAYYQQNSKQPMSSQSKLLIVVLMIATLLTLCYFLYEMEARSLSKLQLKNK